MRDKKATEEEMLKFALKFEQKPCSEQFKTCACCFTCKWVYDCYQAWRRGKIRKCRNRGVSPSSNGTWCSLVAKRIAEILGQKNIWNVPRPNQVSPEEIEKWEDEE